MVGQVVHCTGVPGQGIPTHDLFAEWGATAQDCVYLEGQAAGDGLAAALTVKAGYGPYKFISVLYLF